MKISDAETEALRLFLKEKQHLLILQESSHLTFKEDSERVEFDNFAEVIESIKDMKTSLFLEDFVKIYSVTKRLHQDAVIELAKCKSPSDKSDHLNSRVLVLEDFKTKLDRIGKNYRWQILTLERTERCATEKIRHTPEMAP